MKWIIMAVLLISFIWWQNNGLMVTTITFSNEKLPIEFDDYRVLQISDVHNKAFGHKQSKLLSQIKDLTPDVIVVTGDLFDHSKPGIGDAMLLMEEAVKIAPVYFVSGNHEAWFDMYEAYKQELIDMGVTVLENEKIELIKDHAVIELIGLQDPAFDSSSEYVVGGELPTNLKTLAKPSDDFKLVLSHRPELFDEYVAAQVDLVLAGHAHGGQVRLPFIGGLVAPDQGLLPTYTAGVHTKDDTSMIVSRGLGNSIIPLRLFNRPELVLITLASQE